MKNSDNKIAGITKDLIDGTAPGEWISFLFEVQNSLISYNHLEGYTAKGSSEFAGKFASLKDFFQDLHNLES